MFFAISLFAKDIKPEALDIFSSQFKAKLRAKSLSGFFVYVGENERRIIGCDDAEKLVNLGTASNAITNYLAHKLEKQGKFNRSDDIRTYAKIFKYNSKKITFSDLISSTASIASSHDKLYPKDAQDYEYFDFLWQMNPTLISGAEYDYSALSNLGAIYALSYSQSKKENALLDSFDNLIKSELASEFPSIKLIKPNPLNLSYSLNIIDLTEYLSKELKSFSAINKSEIKRGKHQNTWLFSELNTQKLAILGAKSNDTLLIANFYEKNLAIAIFIENNSDAHSLLMTILQDFTKLFAH